MKRFTLFVMAVLITGFTVIINGQPTLEAAVEEYNKGVMSNNADSLEAAIEHFEKSLAICEELGEEGEDRKVQTEMLLPNLHYNLAMKLFREEKIEEAIAQFKKTVEVATKYNDMDVAQKASRVVPQLHYQLGNDKFGKDDIDGALAEFNTAVELDSTYAKAYYNLARIYRKTENTELFQKNIDKTIALALAQNDSRTLKAAKTVGRDYFLIKANNARTEKKYGEAISYGQITVNYDETSATAHYILAAAYNAQSKWDDAIASANEALKYEKDDPAKKAKVYYELGIAYAAKSDKENACASYKNAAIGPFQQAAEYQIKQVLKCE
ncbi:MAG: tetratricopeptide repeat protein [Bacteroidales bacterium]|nr:tetratricopeptide repeat protein [Bacteroidales bacterium]MBN2762393.1 tetratricopeptide repeat protein [Bacteroidales bacterium]